jgi:hypothetical protein
MVQHWFQTAIVYLQWRIAALVLLPQTALGERVPTAPAVT